MMKREDKLAFLDALYDLYPETKDTQIITRKIITDVMNQKNITEYPHFLTKAEARLERGCFNMAIGLATLDGTPRVKQIVKQTIVHSDVHADESHVVIPLQHAVTSANRDSIPHVTIQPKVHSNIESLIPDVDPNYVPFGNYKDLEKIIKSEMFFPVYITGPSGNGKSAMVEQICAKQKRPMIRVNMTSATDEDVLIGSRTLVNGNIEIVDGPVIKAMRMGAVLLIDEIDASHPNTVLAIQAIAEKGRYYFKLNDEMIHAKPGFNIIATANTKGKGSDDGRYIGTNILNDAFLERFAITMNQEYPSAAIERKIVMNIMESNNCVNEEFADALVKWADAIRKTFDDGGIDEIITTRRLIHIVRTFAIFDDQMKAIALGCNRFDDATTGAFIDLFEKINAPEQVAQPEVVEPASDPVY